jgi:hypothetical protein
MRKTLSALCLVLLAVVGVGCAALAHQNQEPPPPPAAERPLLVAIASDSPLGAERHLGERVHLGVLALGDDLTFQWFDYYGFPIAGATQSTYSFVPYTIDQSGQYACRVTNAGGTVAAQTYVSIEFPKRQ